jgi:ketosteroid isomerase-like protein
LEVTAADTVLAWHAALNDGDIDQLLQLSTSDVEVGGPRGSGKGADLLRDWFGRADVRLMPQRCYANGATVVVEQLGLWPGTEPQIVASVFRIEDGKVARVIRHADVRSALDAAGIQAEL